METLDKVLVGEDVIDSAYILLRNIRFYIGELETPIKIRLYRIAGDAKIRFDQSHFMHTPVQASSYRTDVNYSKDEEGALSRALSTFTMHYKEAVSKGHKPSEKWLVENEYYDRHGF